MHCRKNVKLHNAEQAKPIYPYKNTKIKLYKNNAAIWYNKTCIARQVTPTYANSRCQRTKDAAIRFRINQQIKFQYAKKNNNLMNGYTDFI